MTLGGCATNSAPPDTPATSTPTAVQPPPAPNPPVQKPLTADESDPNKVGWVQDFPPPPGRTIRFDLAGSMFSRTRYGYSHVCEFVSARVMWRGDGPVSKLPRAGRDTSGMLFTDPNSMHRMFAEALELTYADGIPVMHKGKVIYERYFGALDMHTRRIVMSITGSFVGALTAMLVADGKLDPAVPMAQYVPELEDVAYGDTTMCQVMDITVDVRYSENHAGPNADVWAYARAGGTLPRPAGYRGLDSFYDYLATLRKEGEHDTEFAYETVNTGTLTWIVWRASNRSLTALLSERIW